MLLRGPWRTTTFRLAALYGAAYATGMVLLLGLVYLAIANSLTQRWDSVMRAELGILERSGPEGVLQRAQSEAARDPLTRFALYSGAGERIAGDTPLGPQDLPLNGRPRAAPAIAGQPPSRAVAERAPWGEILVVARDTRLLEALRRIVLTALAGSGAVIAGLGLTSGVLLGIGPLRRIAAIRAASEAIGAGDFARRLPVSPTGDEIDELAAIANRMMDEAERLMVQARTVGEGVAHELRSPLTRLRTRLERAATKLDAGDPRRELLETCVAEADSVLGRFAALLRIAALEARGRRVGLGPTSVSGLVAQVGELYEPLAAERGVAFYAHADEGLEIEADGELLFEALCNLVDNAIKFTPGRGLVQLSAAAGPAAVVLEVADDGPGIAEAERALVTKRFYRGQRHAALPGHGLGLSLVAAVADLHGFALAFDDARPGAVVRITCPR
jgi:signal transduction histidine kinase